MSKISTFKHELERLVQNCDLFLRTGELQKGKPEENTKQQLIRPFLELLGYAFEKEIIPEFKVSTKMGPEWVDYALVNEESIPLVFVEAKSLYSKNVLSFKEVIIGYLKDYNKPENKVNKEGFVVSWGVLTNFKELHFFYVGEKEPFLSLKSEEFAANAELIWNLLGYNNLKKDRIAEEYKEKTRRELDKEFLDDLKKWRLVIANGFYQSHHELSIEEIKEASQRWIDRLIFIRIFENKGLLPYHWIRKVYVSWQKDTINKQASPFSDELRKKFREFESIYNTDLFKPDLCDTLDIDNKFISEVIKVYGPPDAKIQEIIRPGQPLLDDAGIYGYNFNSLTIDVLGSIYERYLAYKIEIKNGKVMIEETRDLRKREGAYYTPQYVIDYIIDNTVKPKVEPIHNASLKLLREGKYGDAHSKIKEISNIKVLDPACGSGSFLIKAFDRIARYYMSYNAEVRKIIEEIKKGLNQSHSLEIYSDMPIHIGDVGESIVLNNLFGVDLDPQAVEITKLNLWRALVLLEPDKYDFGTILSKGESKKLPPLDDNIRSGNSLISGTDEELRTYFGEEWQKLKRFNWSEMFKNLTNKDGIDVFDVVVGNPPYVSFGLRGVERIEKELESYFRRRYPDSAEYKISLYAIFMNRAVDLMNNRAMFGFILPDSFLLGRYFSKIRRYILDKTCIIEILMILQDFWSYGTVGRSVIILLQKEQDKEARGNNEIVVRLCPILEDLGKRNYRTYSYEQEYFDRVPYTRFRLFFDKQSKDLVDKLERNTVSLKDIASIHTGVRSKIGQKNIISTNKEGENWHRGLISGSEIGRYNLAWDGHFLNIDPSILWSGGWDPEIVLNDKLIMRQTGDSLYVTFDDEKYYHLNNCHSIAPKDQSYSLKYILAILNSKLMNHYYHLISLELGRALAQTDIETIELLPIKPTTVEKQKEVVDLVDDMLSLNRQKQELLTSFWNLCLNRKTSEKNLLEILANQKLVNAIASRNINPTSWDDKNYRLFDFEEHEDKIIIRSSNDTLMEIVFLDHDFALYVYFVLTHYSEKGRLGNRTLKGLCEYIAIPFITNPEAELKKQIVDELRNRFQNIELPSIERRINETDDRINELVYDVYSVTKEEIALVNKGLAGGYWLCS